MTTFVLGAGASLHAGYPLTAQLGNRLHDWARLNDFMWRGYIEELHEQYGGLADLELILSQLHERPPGSPVAAFSQMHCGNAIGGLRVAIPEYFRSLRQKPIQGPDLYETLAREKVHGDDAILTFNYDLACERALKRAGLWEVSNGYGFELDLDSIPPSKVKLLKLHGSTNWLGILFRGTMGPSQASSAYDYRPAVTGGNDSAFLNYADSVRDPLWQGISRTGGEPALILPTLHKNFFHQTSLGREWEPFWDDIWGQAEQVLRSSNKVVIIGYSMPAADERARQLLLKHSSPDADILVYSGSRSNAISEDFRKCGFHSVKSSGQGYFEDYLNS